MSFIITLYVREGLVMASESRMILNVEQQQGERQVVMVAVGQSDSSYKTFLTPHNVGISTCGAAEFQGIPVAGFMESFIAEQLAHSETAVDEVAQKLLDYFGRLLPLPNIQFHVAGYKDMQGQWEQQVYHVAVAQSKISRLNPPGQQGASWGGEVDILARLIQPTGALTLDPRGNLGQPLPNFQIPWQFFTLQDAIEFAIFAVRTTIDTIRFQPRPKNVGGPIDVLVIKPDRAFWVQRKELHV